MTDLREPGAQPIPQPSSPGEPSPRGAALRARVAAVLAARRRPPGIRPKRPALSPGRAVATVASLSITALAVWVLLFILVFSSVSHARDQHRLYAQFRKEIALATGPNGGIITPGAPVAVLTAPNGGLAGEVVVEGTTSAIMRSGPGHLRTTPLPGQPGVSVVYGRSIAYGGPFGDISSLRAGDEITAVTDQGSFAYKVVDVRRAGDPLPDPVAVGGSRLTLATADGGFLTHGVVYVDADLQGKPAVDPGGRVSTLTSAEGAMATDSDSLSLAYLVFWLQLLLVVAAVLVWLQARWGPWQIWLVGMPIMLVAAWGASDTAVRLLPNMF